MCIWRKKSPDRVSENETPPFPEPRIAFHPCHYLCYLAGEAINIDGKMKEVSWKSADWSEDFVDIEGDLKPIPRFCTRIKMLWDTTYFYVFAALEEPDLWATLRKHDSINFHDNDFELFIVPDGDTYRYYELEVNPFATTWELFLDWPYRDDGRPLFFWEMRGLKVGVSLQGSINHPGDRDQGWSIEIAIPWAALKEGSDREAPP